MEEEATAVCTKVADGRAFVLRTGQRTGTPIRKVKRETRPTRDTWQPDSATLERASEYRLFSTVHSLMVTKNAASRMRQKVINRKRRGKRRSDVDCDVTVTSSQAEEEAQQRAELELESLTEETAEEEETVVKKVVTPNQRTYNQACRKVGVTPATSFYNNIDQSTINLRHHVIGAEGAQACALALVNNAKVQTLDLSDNDLRDEGCWFISRMLSENVSITDLTLADNNVGSEALSDLVDVIIQSDTLLRLDLSGNNFNEHDAVHVARLIKESKSLTDLVLVHNCFREQGGAVIAAALGDNDILETLDLSWNHLRRRGAVEICKSLKLNMALTSLRLAWNGLSHEGCKALGASLPTNAVLKLLDLSCNRIDQRALVVLLKGVQKNTALKKLKLTNNPLGTEGANAILSAILKNEHSAMEELDISDQCVDQTFLELKRALMDARDLVILHGITLSQDSLHSESEEAFSRDDPMMVLMEFMRLENLRLVDLFATLDKDGSKTLTRDEFKNGLLGVSIPMSPEALDGLINKLDADGDGEVDFKELIAGQREHKKKLQRLKQKQIDMPFEETELGKLSTKLKAIMILRRGMRKRVGHDGSALAKRNSLLPPQDGSALGKRNSLAPSQDGSALGKRNSLAPSQDGSALGKRNSLAPGQLHQDSPSRRGSAMFSALMNMKKT